MENAWAFSALSAGSAFIAKSPSVGFAALTGRPEIVAAVARLFRDVISGVAGLHRPKRRNQFLDSTEFVLQLNGKIRRCVIAEMGFATSYTFGAIGTF